jgi:hypothetical protein
VSSVQRQIAGSIFNVDAAAIPTHGFAKLR